MAKAIAPELEAIEKDATWQILNDEYNRFDRDYTMIDNIGCGEAGHK